MYVEEYLDVRLCNRKRPPAFTPGLSLRRETPDMGTESSQLISAPAKNIYICYKTEKTIRQVRIIWEECRSLDFGDLYDTGNYVLCKR